MLSIVATPIGNLGDITDRAKKVLSEVSAIICEDTRVTGGLLHNLGLPKKELISLHGYTDPRKLEGIIDRLNKDENWSAAAVSKASRWKWCPDRLHSSQRCPHRACPSTTSAIWASCR
jgi:16S rRNA (cytidine1402-2'-O)-methyltransferase